MTDWTYDHKNRLWIATHSPPGGDMYYDVREAKVWASGSVYRVAVSTVIGKNEIAGGYFNTFTRAQKYAERMLYESRCLPSRRSV